MNLTTTDTFPESEPERPRRIEEDDLNAFAQYMDAMPADLRPTREAFIARAEISITNQFRREGVTRELVRAHIDACPLLPKIEVKIADATLIRIERQVRKEARERTESGGSEPKPSSTRKGTPPAA